MENIKDILDNFDKLSFAEKLTLKKRLRIDTFIAERKGDTLQSIGINIMLVGEYFYSIGKKEFWFFPLNEKDYKTYLEWIFTNVYLDYTPFDTLKKNFLERFNKHKFKEKLISELILEYEKRLSGEIEGSIINWSRNKEFYKLGVVLFEEGSELNYNHFKSFYYKKWNSDATLSVSSTFTEILSCFLKGYFDCQFYLFLIEQQKRLLKGEDITKPFEVEEVKEETIITNIELNQIIEDLRKIPSFKRGIKPYLALFTYYLNESSKIQPRLISEKDIMDFSEKLFQNSSSSFKNLYSKMKNQKDARIKQLDLLKNSNEGLEVYKKYFDLINIITNNLVS
jgi:hypothetical protein